MEKKYNAKIDNLKNDIEKLKQNIDTLMEKLVEKTKKYKNCIKSRKKTNTFRRKP